MPRVSRKSLLKYVLIPTLCIVAIEVIVLTIITKAPLWLALALIGLGFAGAIGMFLVIMRLLRFE